VLGLVEQVVARELHGEALLRIHQRLLAAVLGLHACILAAAIDEPRGRVLVVVELIRGPQVHDRQPVLVDQLERVGLVRGVVHAAIAARVAVRGAFARREQQRARPRARARARPSTRNDSLATTARALHGFSVGW
jgi:hypothetical protein